MWGGGGGGGGGVGGDDFNVLRCPGERNREGRMTSCMRRFSQFIDDLELKDLHLKGGMFYLDGGQGIKEGLD